MLKADQIKIDEILADEQFNCRGHINKADVVPLVRSIKEQGLIQPVVVQPLPFGHESGKNYRLLAGYRRFNAFCVLRVEDQEKYGRIPAVIRDDTMSEIDAQYFNISENLSREDLTPVQEARVVTRLYEQGETEASIAERLSKSKSWVSIRRSLFELPEEIQDMVEGGFIKQSNIKELYTIMKKLGKDKTLEQAKKLKDATIQGKKNVSVNIHKLDPTKRRVRGKKEIEALQDHILDSPIGPGLHTIVLGWCIGAWSDVELFDKLQEWADDRGIEYERPGSLEADNIIGLES